MLDRIKSIPTNIRRVFKTRRMELKLTLRQLNKFIRMTFRLPLTKKQVETLYTEAWHKYMRGYDVENMQQFSRIQALLPPMAAPQDFISQLNKYVMTQTVMAGECAVRTTSTDFFEPPQRATNIRWPGEVIEKNTDDEKENKYTNMQIPVHVVLFNLTATNSALEDPTFSIEDELAEAFSEAAAVMYDTMIIGGDGQGKPGGIVNKYNLESIPNKINAPHPGWITADDILALFNMLPAPYRARAKWYMNSNTALHISTLKTLQGVYLINANDPELVSAGVPDRLFDKPIVLNEYMDNIAYDASPIIFGSMEQAYCIGKRSDFSIRRFNDSSYAALDQVLFLGRARLGGDLFNPEAVTVLHVLPKVDDPIITPLSPVTDEEADIIIDGMVNVSETEHEFSPEVSARIDEMVELTEAKAEVVLTLKVEPTVIDVHVGNNHVTVFEVNELDFTDGDLLKLMLFKMLPREYRPAAKWYMNPNTGIQVSVTKDSEGNYMIDTRDEGLNSNGMPFRLLGKPVMPQADMDDVAPGGFPILFATFTASNSRAVVLHIMKDGKAATWGELHNLLERRQRFADIRLAGAVTQEDLKVAFKQMENAIAGTLRTAIMG